ncbi:hypothetical protein HK101_011181 [Irineochytrium annulatum]|nr:hypothetical protein HK101_011181 [Irineochytrium annulatum]
MKTVYGGKIDNSFDQKILETFVDSLFNASCFDLNFSLISSTNAGDNLSIPESNRVEEIMKWVNALPDQQSPVWLGLPANAERVLMASNGLAAFDKIRKMRSLSLDDEVVFEKPSSSDAATSHLPPWIRTVRSLVPDWLDILPKEIHQLAPPESGGKDPMYRFFEREYAIGSSLLKTVRNDLVELIAVCDGKLKLTNHTRALVESVTKGGIPAHWRRYKVPKNFQLTAWVQDFKRRLDQLDQIITTGHFDGLTVWLGGLFLPEAFVTVTRQTVAQKKGWSLEELVLSVKSGSATSNEAFSITGD